MSHLITLALFTTCFFSCLSCFAISHTPSYSLHEMSLDEKVGQLLMVQFMGETINEDAVHLIHKIHIGGIIYYNWANGLNSPQQVLHLSEELQASAHQTRLHIPLLIAADQEGGLVARLTKGFTVFPGNQALGMTSSPQIAKQAAYAMGQELRAVGVNFNLAPVVDINSNPRNPVIGIRAFGDSPDTVIPFATEALSGYHDAGVITALKHFPGHGDVEVDSHVGLPFLVKSKEQLQGCELLPFAALAPQADTIMTAHIMVPSIDPINCATLSKSILSILRDEIGFQGVIITDSLVMEGVLQNSRSVDEAAIRAFNAGCDILLLGGQQLISNNRVPLTVEDIERIHQSLVHAVKQGIISEKRLNESVQRILDLKNKHDLSVVKKSSKELHNLVNTPSHNELANYIAALALRVVTNRPLLQPLDQSKIFVIAPKIAFESINNTSLLELGWETSSLFFNGLSPTDTEIQLAINDAEDADYILFCSYSAWKNPSQINLSKALIATKKPVIVFVLRDALDEALFSEAAILITTFSQTAPAIQAACDRLLREAKGL